MMSREIQNELSQPSSRLELRLRDFCKRRLDAADRRWSQRHARWREAERLYRAFRVPDDQDIATREDTKTEGVEKIVVPYSYAVLQSMLAFFMTVFTSRKPLIPVEGMGPKDVRAALLMEAHLDYQCEMMEPTYVLVFFQWLLDSLRYGVGIIKNAWTIREWPELVRETQPLVDPFTGRPVGVHDTLIERDVVSYEGNEAMNVSPFDFFPDPRRSLSDFQRGEFVAFRVRRSWTELEQRAAEGLYVGIEHIGKTTQEVGYGGLSMSNATGQSDLARIAEMDDGDNGAIDDQTKGHVDLHEMYAYCHPDQLGLTGGGQADPLLSPSTGPGTPRLWVFTLANLNRVVRAEPANLPGRRFPCEIIELNYDFHSPANHGIIETFRGLQYIMSWLFNTRMMAVRRTLNNELVVDPSLIEEVDLLDPEPGRLLRLKREAWNSGLVDKAVYPIPIQDTTASHHADSRIVAELIQTITGANQLIMGLPNPGRRAATEVQGQLNLASGRMKMLVEIVAAQGMRPHARQMARNTQTFLDSHQMALKEPYASLLGAPWVQITPDMLKGEFAFPFNESGIPTDRMFEANVWKELLMMGLQSGVAAPLLAKFPWPQILGRFLRAMNVKDLQTFGLTLPNLVVQPDDMVAAAMQAGNLVPGASPGFTGGNVGMAGDGLAQPDDTTVPGVGANGQGSPEAFQ